MKRALAGFLCLGMILAGISGCSEESRETAASVEAAPAQMETSQAAETAPEEKGAAVATAEPKEDPPLELDERSVPEEGIRIAVVAKSTEGGYWKCMKRYMREAVGYINEFYGLEGEDAVQVTFEGPDQETEVEDQINTIDAVLAENPSVLCLAAIDMNSCQAQIETARDNGIPVVFFDSGVKNGDGMAFCATDNQAAGAEAARRLCAAMGERGTAVVFADAACSQAARGRVRGFRTEIEADHADVAVKRIFAGESDEDTQQIIRRVLDNGQADGIFCTSQAVAEQVLSVLEDYPEADIPLVGFDAGRLQIQAIQEGRETGTILQDIPGMARQTIQAALYAAMPGQTDGTEGEIKVEHVWADSQNLADAEEMDLLYD